MTAVYKARPRESDRFTAVKILRPEVACIPICVDRFIREVQEMARLTHPNIVAAYGIGQKDGMFYFEMEFVEGVDLRQAMQAGTLSPQVSLAVVRQICGALQHAHDEGVIHHDIRPEKILLNKRGHVKITGFGGGRPILDVRLTASQQKVRTSPYLAPEQRESTTLVDHRADIYSFGVVFYEMLTGELPRGEFVPPSERVQLDQRLDEVLRRMLAKEPERRYQNVRDLKTDVDTISRLTR